MTIDAIIQHLRNYPFFDLVSGDVVQKKQIAGEYATAELIHGFVKQYGASVKFIPKRMNGNSPYQLTEQAVSLTGTTAAVQQQLFDNAPQNPYSPQMHGLGSIQSSQSMPEYYRQPQQSHYQQADNWKIHYDQAREELRDLKVELREERDKRHHAELRLAGEENKKGGLDGIASVVSALAPALPAMMSMGMNGLGAAPAIAEQTTHAPAQQNLQKIDARAAQIVKYYASLDDDSKTAVYEHLNHVFSDLTTIDRFNEFLNGTDDDE